MCNIWAHIAAHLEKIPDMEEIMVLKKLICVLPILVENLA